MRDLEIYIRDLDPVALKGWLSGYFERLEVAGQALPTALEDRPIKLRGDYCGAGVRVSVYPQAGGKRYASLVIEGEELPWESDLACGRSAWQAMTLEIRCSPGDWQEGASADDERWWRIDQRGEQLAVWN